MDFHKKNSTFRFGIIKCKTKQIDNINIVFFSISLNGLAKNLYMNIKIYSYNVDWGKVRISYLVENLVL